MSSNERFATPMMDSTPNPAPVPTPSAILPRKARATLHIQRISPQVRITPQARCYAIAELARRGGISAEFQKQWTIRVDAKETTITLDALGEKTIVFPHASPDLLRELSGGRIRTVRRRWMYSPKSATELNVPDFLVPFAKDTDNFPKTLFISRGPGKLECTVDLPLSILMTLSRWEETLKRELDHHGRFPAKDSVACRDGFLHRPIVDEYGLAFQQAMQVCWPGWQPLQKSLRIKLSHDADHVGIPFRWRDALRHTTHYRRPLDSARDLFGAISGSEPRDLRALREIVRLSLSRNLDSAVYWKASQPTPHDSGYDPRHRKIRDIIAWLVENQVECGVQPGYETFRAPEKLRREVQILREAMGAGPLGGRQHYLRWCPETWIHWETCGLAYDSSVCFAERIGFRAGTCVPYRPWLFTLNRPAQLLEIPLLVMDRTLLNYMKLTHEQSIEAVRDCLARCRTVGGVFTLVWHNNHMLDAEFRTLYLKLLPLLVDGERHDWVRDCRSGLEK
jgi:uncharacterized protein DUF7033